MKQIKLNGTRLHRHRFKLRETARVVDNDALMSVLSGRSPAHLVREFLSPEESRQLAEAYRQRQAKLREDGVPAREIGAGGYGLSVDEYFEKVARTRAEMEDVYAAAGVHLATVVDEALQAAVDPGITVRPALKGGRAAAQFRAIHFCDEGPLALKPHEDRAQLGTSPEVFEAAGAHVVSGANVYASTSSDTGGALRIWNIVPSKEAKAALGVEHTGYPYAVELLESIDFIDIRPSTGDLLIFSADFIHAVTSWTGSAEERIVFQSFMGLAGGKVLRWT